MIDELVMKMVEKLRAKEGLSGIKWHYGEPVEMKFSDKGEGYVSLVPIEPQLVEPQMRGERHNLQFFVCVAYRHINEETCDKWLFKKTELIWEVFKENENWDGLCEESHLIGYNFLPSLDGDFTFDKMFSRLKIDVEVNPAS